MSYKNATIERIDVSEGIGINKSNKSKEYMLCHYWYFKDISFKFQSCACNGCHVLSMMVYDLDDFMILNIKGIDYRCFVFNIRAKIQQSNGIW